MIFFLTFCYRFDIILDHKGKPILLEVNHTPSFSTDTPLDDSVKFSVIHDTLKLMNLSVNNRIKYKNNLRIEFQKRALLKNKYKLSPSEKH